MSIADTARRTVSVLLAALCFVVVPSIATASFTDRATVTASVGTAALEAPTAVLGTYTCKNLGADIEVDISSATLTGGGPSGVGIRYDLVRPSGAVADTVTVASSTSPASLDDSLIDWQNTSWRLEARVLYRNWTSAPVRLTATCPTLRGTKTYPL